MRYMLLCYDDEQAWDQAGEAAMQEAMEEAVRLAHELKARGQYLTAAPLHSTSTATSVRVRDGRRLVTDGPFAETREQLGGFYLIDAKDLDEAIGIAARHPGARLGTVEIRPVMELPGLPTQSNEKRDLVFSRVFAAPVERVWKAWTDSEQVMRWWGPDGFSCPLAKIDFREGGVSIVCMRAPKEFGGQDMYSTWTYTKIVPLKEIEWLHHFADKHGKRIDPTSIGLPADMPPEVRNLATFKAVGDKTHLTVTEYDWTVGHVMEMSKVGMEQCLDKMAAIFDQR